jgi:hypothetical protein
MELLLWADVDWFHVPTVNVLSYVGAIIVLGGAVLAIGVFNNRKK